MEIQNEGLVEVSIACMMGGMREYMLRDEEIEAIGISGGGWPLTATQGKW